MKTTFFWDELEDNIVREYDTNNNTTAHYTTMPTLYGWLLRESRETDLRFFHCDGHSNTTELTDTLCIVTDVFRYSAFSDSRQTSGTSDTPFKWGGSIGYSSSPQEKHTMIRRRHYNPQRCSFLSKDPSDSGGNFQYYLVSHNSPINLGDPSGLNPLLFSLLLFSHCQRPNGFDYINGRTDHIIASIQPSEELGKYASLFQFYWYPTRPAFGAMPCCCCTSVGFVQVVIAQLATYISFFGIVKDGQTDTQVPHIDSGFPYPYSPIQSSNTSSPCVTNGTSGQLALTDSPSPGAFFWQGWQMYSFEQHFETCVVCLEGYEGPTYERLGWELGGGPAYYDYSVTALAIYGCLTWGHKYVYDPVNKTIHWQRYIDTTFGEDAAFTGALHPPSEAWIHGVRKGFLRVL